MQTGKGDKSGAPHAPDKAKNGKGDKDKNQSKKQGNAGGKAGGKSGYQKRPDNGYFTNFYRRRGGEGKPIGELLPKIGRAAFHKFGFVQHNIITRWEEIVGTRYAGITQPQSLRFPGGKRSGGTLNLLVNGVDAMLIQYEKQALIERVNRFFGYGAVANVKFRQGTVPDKMDAQKSNIHRMNPGSGGAHRAGQADHPHHIHRDNPPALHIFNEKIGENLAQIGDEELRTIMNNLANSMAQKHMRQMNDEPVQNNHLNNHHDDKKDKGRITGDNIKPIDPDKWPF